ncbi:MAG: DUF5320 domain-containing protein [Bacillota bacterium]
MPNMDGTGPRIGGHHMGRGRGICSGTGRNFVGYRCGTGPCCQTAQNEKAALEARREALQRSLDSIEKRLETL